MYLSIIIFTIFYLFIILGINIYSSKNIEINEDFAIAGKNAKTLYLASAIVATEIGVASSLGVFEKAYGDWGLSASWYIITMALAFIFISFFSHNFRQIRVKTIPEYFRKRYGKSSGLFSALLMIFPLIILTLVQVVAAGKVLSILLNVDYKLTVTFVSLFIVLYTTIGGQEGLIKSKFFYVIIFIIGMFLIIPNILQLCWDYPTAIKNISDDKLNLLNGISIPTIISLLIMYIATFCVGQEVASFFYSAKKPSYTNKASRIASIILFVFAFIPVFLGLLLLSLKNMGRIDENIIFIDGIRYGLLYYVINYANPFILGVLLLSLLSITMSSADSDLLAIGIIFSNDIYKVHLDKTADDEQVIRITRIVIIMFGIIVYLLALFNKPSIINLLIFTFSLRAAGAFIPYIFGLYWKKSSSIGALASLILGSISFIIFKFIQFDLFGFEPIIYSLIVSLVAFILFSKLFPPVIESLELVED